MAYQITAKQINDMIVNEWKTMQNTTYKFRDTAPDSVTLTAGADEMLRVAKDGFYVRGVKVPADTREAETVYFAFKQWLAWANLQRN